MQPARSRTQRCDEIAFTRGGRRIATLTSGGSNDFGPTTIRFWDADGLLAIGEPVPLAQDVIEFVVSRDGSHALHFELPNAWVQRFGADDRNRLGPDPEGMDPDGM